MRHHARGWFTRHLTTAALAAAIAGTLLAGGCAYQRHYGAGERALAGGDYRAALAEFEQAAAQPYVRSGDDLPAKLAAARAGVAGQVAREAEAAAGRGETGRAWALASRAAQLDATHQPLLSSLAAHLVAERALKVAVHPRDARSAAAMDALTSAVAARSDLRLVPDPAAAELRMDFFIGTLFPQNTTTLRRKLVRYEVRRDKVPNAELGVQRARVAAARERLAQARRTAENERDAMIQTNIVAKAKDNRNLAVQARQRWDDAGRQLKSVEQDLAREVKRLDETPEMREVPVYDTLQFEYKLHTQAMTAPVAGTLTDVAGTTPPAKIDLQAEVAWAFEEYEAQPVAKLPASIPELRTEEELEFELASRAGKLLGGLLVDRAERRAGELLATARRGDADDETRARAFATLLAQGRKLEPADQQAADAVFARLAGNGPAVELATQ